MSLLKTPPVKSDVGCMSERGNGGVNEVPCTTLAKLTLLTHTHPTVGNLLHYLGQFLCTTRLHPNKLSCACLQSSSMPNKHNVPTVGPHSLEDQSGDVKHALVELQVGFLGFEILQSHLRGIAHVHLQAKLGQLPRAQEGGESPLTPRQPLKHTIFNLDSDGGILQPLQDSVGCLHAPQRW